MVLLRVLTFEAGVHVLVSGLRGMAGFQLEQGFTAAGFGWILVEQRHDQISTLKQRCVSAGHTKQILRTTVVMTTTTNPD